MVELFERWLEHVPAVVRGWELEPVDVALAVPGEHNRRNAAAALAALELAGVDRADAEPALARFRGAGRRFELVGERGGVTVVDDYAHHPTEIAAAIAAAREREPGRVLVLFQPHLYSRTRHLAHEFGERALDRRRRVRDRDLPRAGGAGRGRHGQARARRAPARPPRRVGADRRGRRRASSRRWARAGDTVLTLGAGDVDRAGRLLLELL